MTDLDPQQLKTYLTRIGIETPPPTTLDGLKTLLSAHQQAVPFENLSVLLDDPIILDEQHLFDKIVTHRRGGYCFENNGLFALLLRSMGFSVRPLACRVWYRVRDSVSPKTHTVNLVKVQGEKFIIDVGFGGTTPRIAVPVREGKSSDVDGPIFVEKDREHGWMLSRAIDGGFHQQFSFGEETVYPNDLVVANHYMSTHTSSHFLHGLRLSIFTPNGKRTLAGNQLTIREGENHESSTIQFDASLDGLLQSAFGLHLGSDFPKLLERLNRLPQ